MSGFEFQKNSVILVCNLYNGLFVFDVVGYTGEKFIKPYKKEVEDLNESNFHQKCMFAKVIMTNDNSNEWKMISEKIGTCKAKIDLVFEYVENNNTILDRKILTGVFKMNDENGTINFEKDNNDDFQIINNDKFVIRSPWDNVNVNSLKIYINDEEMSKMPRGTENESIPDSTQSAWCNLL